MKKLTSFWAAVVLGVVPYFLAGLAAALFGQTDAIFTVDLAGHAYFAGFGVIPFLVAVTARGSDKSEDMLLAASVTQGVLFFLALAGQYYMFCHLSDGAQAALGFVVLPFYLFGIALVLVLLLRLGLYLRKKLG